MKNRPELLAPAGERTALEAAVQNGADAVYLGAGNFNARRTAGNFDGSALDDAVTYCHSRNVHVYVTLNTMVREDELDALAESIEAICRSGADAVIVQDFGTARAVREIAPHLQLHASTQMAVHNREGVDFLVQNGFSRVVLAREMTLDEIQACVGRGASLEVFVHGALCVACSGQCLMSSLVGGRSGNRGLCAQPCRLRYRMDDIEGHLLSTRDLCTLDQLEALCAAGVDSLKIEGRLKRPEYVATVTAAYRAALDSPHGHHDDTPLKQMFNRGGFTRGYLPGVDDTELMYAQRPNHLGVQVGRALRDGQLRLEVALDPADMLVLRREGTEDRPIQLDGGISGTVVPCSLARRGDALIRLVSDVQMRTARESFTTEHRATKLSAGLYMQVGQPARLTVTDGIHTAQAEGKVVEPATSRAPDPERIQAQIRKTGGTPYSIDSVSLTLDANAFCPVSELNALRRDALEALTKLRLPASITPMPLLRPFVEPYSYPQIPAIRVQSSKPDVLCRALEYGADGVIFSPDDVRPEALASVSKVLPERFSLALPMVLPSQALATLNAWANDHSDRLEDIYLSNIGQFALRWPGAHVADFSLNAANELALLQLREWGCVRYTPSVELNCGQINLLSGARELIVHGRLPLMQLRHCPYRAVHGLKGRHADCQRCDHCAPTDHIDAHTLTDRMAAEFPLRRLATEEGCIIRLMNSVPLMLLKRIQKLPKADVWRLLIDDLDEAAVVPLYRKAAHGEVFHDNPNWPTFESMNTTSGHYFRGAR